MRFSLPTIPTKTIEPRISLTEVRIEIKPRLLRKYPAKYVLTNLIPTPVFFIPHHYQQRSQISATHTLVHMKPHMDVIARNITLILFRFPLFYKYQIEANFFPLLNGKHKSLCVPCCDMHACESPELQYNITIFSYFNRKIITTCQHM